MRVKVLGSSGGVALGYRTTSILLDEDVLIDAGTGVVDLTVKEMTQIRKIFITHSHMDHIASLPLLCDTVYDSLESPIELHALPATLQAIKDHIFNDVIWPDFTRIKKRTHPVLQLIPMNPGDSLQLGNRRIEMVGVNHLVPGAGYIIENDTATVAFSGDTTTNDSLWEALNRLDRLDILLVEAAFPDSHCDLAIRSGHYCPSLLAADLKKLKHNPKIYISHPKPGEEITILEECLRHLEGKNIVGLLGNEEFKL